MGRFGLCDNMTPISRKEALEISAGILKQAEAERLAVAEYKGVSFNLYRKDGEFRLECDELQICLSSVSLADLLQEFHDDIYFIHKEYGCSSEIMTMDALVLQDNIQQFMGDEK